jgi:hypothetical protein
VKTVFILLFSLSLSYSTQAQDCDCQSDFNFMADTYLADYSGLRDFAARNPGYRSYIDTLRKQASSKMEIRACDSLLKKLIHYLDNGHVFLVPSEINPVAAMPTEGAHKDPTPTLSFKPNSTALFTVPTCNMAYKPILDSLVLTNIEKLEKTRHFIIDVRGNGGGGDAMFASLLPYLYTNPILVYNSDFWSSPNNIRFFEELLSNEYIPEDAKNQIRDIVSRGKQAPNQFVPFATNRIDTIRMDEIKAYPKKVSVLMDKECISATEQFLLNARQSKKTRIYGYSNSGGAIDYGNLNFVFTPSKLWYFSVPTTRSARLPDYPVDPTGIAPDVKLKPEIKDPIKWLVK